MIIRIATRKSPLALWQANHVYDAIRSVDPSLKVYLEPVKTKVDRDLKTPISEFKGKGAFSKEVQQLVLDGKADIAVHSAKDLQVDSPRGLQIAAFPKRGEPHDVMVGAKLNSLGPKAIVGTGSSRRKALLLDQRPDLHVVDIRGNIDTRLRALNELDAIVMAACALNRLGRKPAIVDELDPGTFIPQVGQGALAVESRSDDSQLLELLSSIDHVATRTEVEAERDFLRSLGGDCDFPAGAYCQRYDSELSVRGFIADTENQRLVRAETRGYVSQLPGSRLARQLVSMHSDSDGDR